MRSWSGPPEKIKLIDLNSWQLLNLPGDLIVKLPGIVGEKCFPDGTGSQDEKGRRSLGSLLNSEVWGSWILPKFTAI